MENTRFIPWMLTPALWLVSATLCPAASHGIAEPPAAGDLPGPPRLHPNAYPRGVGDENEYAAWLQQRTQVLLSSADATQDAMLGVRRRLAAVNWMLAAECEPPLSRRLLGMKRDGDAALIRAATQTCARQMETARTTLANVPSHDADDAAADPLASAADALTAFNGALAALVNGDELGADAVRAAARNLALYLEDSRPQVAAAATLFQARLYSRAGDTGRALRLLPLIPEPPDPEALETGLFLRLHRCQLLAQQGQHAAAWALLAMLDERVNDWFATRDERDRVHRTVAYAKLRVCDQWTAAIESAESATRTDTAAWCGQMARDLRDAYFPADAAPTVARLATAVPYVIDIPDPDGAPPRGDDASPGAAQSQPDDSDAGESHPDDAPPRHDADAPSDPH